MHSAKTTPGPQGDRYGGKWRHLRRDWTNPPARTRGFAVLGCLLLLATAGQASDVPGSLQEGIFAKPLERPLARYPEAALREGREGWAHVSFMVSPEGDVSEVLLEDSSGGRAFERAALQSVRRWSYTPAQLDGEPVEQCSTNVLIRFTLDTPSGKRGATRPFIRRYERMLEELGKGNDAAARELLDELDARTRNLYESARVSVIRGTLAARAGKPKEELTQLRKATVGSGEYLEASLYRKLLVRILTLEIQHQSYGEALATHARLLDLGSEVPETLAAAVGEIERRRDSGISFKANAVIGPADEDHHGDGVWRYKVVGRKPGIADVEGRLGKLELRCDFRRVVTKAQSNRAWRIPESWGSCWVYVFGEPGAKFSLIEHPNS